MPERQAAVENSEHAALREEICAECTDARRNLNLLVQAEQAPDWEQRRAEILPWVIDNLRDCPPPELAVEACLQIEADEAAAGFPDFRLDDLPLAELREEVQVFIAEAEATARNKNASGEIADGVPAKVPAEAGKESALLAEEDELEAEHEALKTQNVEGRTVEARRLQTAVEKEGRTAELRQLQATFNELRADGLGTVEALRHVIADAENPETKQHLNTLLGRVSLLQTALPDKPDVVNRLLNTAGLNLAAVTVADSFFDFMIVAETDEALTDDDRAILRRIVAREERYVRTGTQVQTELGRKITDNAGRTVPVHTSDQPFKVRDLVQGYAETNGTQKLRATTVHGERVELDITGWSGADVGRASELLQLWAMTENEGQTGHLSSPTRLNWTGTGQIDPIALQYASQVVSALLGHGEGHDGDIFDDRDALGIIRWQAQLANQTGAALRGTRDEKRTHDALVGLGIRDKNGNIDLNALRVFGEYSLDHWMTKPDFVSVQEHLCAHSKSVNL